MMSALVCIYLFDEKAALFHQVCGLLQRYWADGGIDGAHCAPLPPSDEGGGFCRRQKAEGEIAEILTTPQLRYAQQLP